MINTHSNLFSDPKKSFLERTDDLSALLNKNKEIDELKIWYDEMKINPIFSSKSGLNQISLKILYREIMQAMMVDGFKKNFIKVIKYPFCFYKIRLIVALLLPKFVLKKIKNY